MSGYVRFLVERLLILVATIALSVTIVFFVPHLVPGDPLSAIKGKLASVGANVGGEGLVADYTRRFGLDRPLGEQYLAYVRGLLSGDLGYSIASFPTTVVELLRLAIPWTVGLLAMTTVISWLIGSIIGGLVGWTRKPSPLLQALVPLALRALHHALLHPGDHPDLSCWPTSWPIFPLSGAYSPDAQPQLTFGFALDVLHHAALPALSIVLVSLGWWFLSMRSLIISVREEDYVLWAEAKGLARPPHLLGVRLPQCAAAASHRPGAVDGPDRRRCADHRGDLRLSGARLARLQRHQEP